MESAVASLSRDTATDSSSLIVSISLSKLEDRLRLKAFSIPKLKAPSSAAAASPTPSSSFGSPSLPPAPRATVATLPPVIPSPFQGRPPPPPGQIPFPLVQQSPRGSPNAATQPVPLFPPKPPPMPPGIMAPHPLPPLAPPRLPQQPQFRPPPPPGNLAGPLPPNLPPQGNPGGLPPPPPVPAMQPPPIGENSERKVLLPTPPSNMRVLPEELKKMKPVEYWEDPSVTEDSNGLAPLSNQDPTAPSANSQAPPPPPSSQGMLPLPHPHGDLFVQPGAAKPPTVGPMQQQFQVGGPALMKPLAQHEVNATPTVRETIQGGFRLDPRQSRLAAAERPTEGDPRQWHCRQPDRASSSVQNVPYGVGNTMKEPGMMTTPYPMDPKRTPPYQTESASDAQLYLSEPSHSSAALASQSSPSSVGMAPGMKQEGQRHFPADKPPASWGLTSCSGNEQQPQLPYSSSAGTAFQPAPRPAGDVSRREGDNSASRRVDPRLKYAHLKIKSKKPGAESDAPRPPSLPPSLSSSTNKKGPEDGSRDKFEVPKLLQDPSALNKPIDPRELFRNAGGENIGSLGYEIETSGPFGLFKSNLFSSRSQQNTDHDKGDQQQFGEITLRGTTPPKGYPSGTSIIDKDNASMISSGQSQVAGDDSTTESSGSAGSAQSSSVPSYLAQLDMGLGKDLKIESALGALASKSTTEETKVEEKARKLPNIFV